MSILIRDMDMPKNCKSCPLRYSSTGYAWCDITGASLALEIDMRDYTCPLIELPPHGRLGDLDVLQEQIKFSVQDAHMSILWKQGMAYAHGLVEASKTIIEAEGETDA